MAVLVCYNLSQLKFMINPLCPQYLPASVVEKLYSMVSPELFTITQTQFLDQIRSVM